MTQPSFARLAIATVATALTLTACVRDDADSLVRPTNAPSALHTFRPVPPPLPDAVMGSLSPVAQHLAAGLQDSIIRMSVREALLNPRASVPELDLQSCDDSTGVVGALLRSGERRGAGLARGTCTTLKAMSGAILYMDPTQLAHWDGATIPVVTAIAHPGQRLPASIRGYRTPGVTMDLPTDGRMAGPVLAVLPITHESRLPVRATAPSVRAVFVPNPKPSSP